MMIYIAQTRTRRLNRIFEEMGIGAMHCRGRMDRPRVSRWAMDNGAFVDWQKGREFNAPEFVKDLDRLPTLPPPDFVVLPDRVAQGMESLRFSMEWFDGRPRPDWYLAVQNGMNPFDIPWRSGIAGIFIGGTTEWKWDTMPLWVRFAGRHGLPVHVGRISSPRRLIEARAYGVTSGDTSQPLWSRQKMAAFLLAVTQGTLWKGPIE